MSARLDGRRALITGGANGSERRPPSSSPPRGPRSSSPISTWRRMLRRRWSNGLRRPAVRRRSNRSTCAMRAPFATASPPPPSGWAASTPSWRRPDRRSTGTVRLVPLDARPRRRAFRRDLRRERARCVPDVPAGGSADGRGRAWRIDGHAGVDGFEAPDGGRLLGLEGGGLDADEVPRPRARRGGIWSTRSTGYVETELFANMVRTAVGDDPDAERGRWCGETASGRSRSVATELRSMSRSARFSVLRRVERLHRRDPAPRRGATSHDGGG